MVVWDAEKPKIRDDSVAALELFNKRATTFTEEMTEQANARGRNTGPVNDEERVLIAARFIVEAAEFIDSIDHRTTTEMGGTNPVQNLAHETRNTANTFITDIEGQL